MSSIKLLVYKVWHKPNGGFRWGLLLANIASLWASVLLEHYGLASIFNLLLAWGLCYSAGGLVDSCL